MKSLFTGIDSSSHIAVSSAQVIYSFFFLNLFFCFIVIANIFFYKSIAWSLLSRIPYSVSLIPLRFHDSVSVSGFPIPYFSAAQRSYLERVTYLNIDLFTKEGFLSRQRRSGSTMTFLPDILYQARTITSF